MRILKNKSDLFFAYQDEMCNLGDRVLYGGEEGIITSIDPIIMRNISFHSYVPIIGDGFSTIVEREQPEATMRKEVIDRIKKYLMQIDRDVPTGHEGE